MCIFGQIVRYFDLKPAFWNEQESGLIVLNLRYLTVFLERNNIGKRVFLPFHVPASAIHRGIVNNRNAIGSIPSLRHTDFTATIIACYDIE